MRFAIPLLLFFGVIGFLLVGLERDPRLVPSPLINKPVPDFRLASLHDEKLSIDARDLVGEVTVFNVWASWCAACRDEHPLLMNLIGRDDLRLVGMNYKDQRDAGIAWLKRHGNPYEVSVFDPEGRLGLDLGVYGVPETFVLDKQGVIRAKHVGPLDAETLTREILDVVARLNGS